MDQKISELPVATVPDGTELVPIVQDGVTRQTTVANIGGNGWINIKSFGAVGDGATSDAAAFAAFNTWALAEQTADPGIHIQLYIPPGDYVVTAFYWALGLKNVTIAGYGATLDYGYFGGGTCFHDDNTHSARLQTTTAGGSTVTLVTLADNSKFAVGDWVYISAIDLQGFGSPPSHQLFEYNKIAAIDTGTGVVTLQGALTHVYKSTYPLWWAGDGGHPDQGGPATMYKLQAGWDCKFLVYGLTITNASGFKARECHFIDCHWDECDLNPTCCKLATWTRCIVTGGMEQDKCVENVMFRDCFIRSMVFQSSSFDKCIIENCRFSNGLTGTSKNMVIRNTEIPSIIVGTYAYGIMESLYLENCNVRAISFSAAEIYTTAMTFINGFIRRTLASMGGPDQWLIPGAYGVFGKDDHTDDVLPPVFRVTDFYTDATYLYLKTTIPEPEVIPLSQYGIAGSGTATEQMKVYRFSNIRAVNCTGCADIVDLCNKGERQAHSYRRRAYAGNPNPSYDYLYVFGWLQQFRVNVIRAYSGVSGTLTLTRAGTYALLAGNVASTFTFTVNLKVAGERIISPAGNTGIQSGDTLPTAQDYWIPGSLAIIWSSDISTEDPSLWPLIEVEVITDHGDGIGAPWASRAGLIY